MGMPSFGGYCCAKCFDFMNVTAVAPVLLANAEFDVRAFLTNPSAYLSNGGVGPIFQYSIPTISGVPWENDGVNFWSESMTITNYNSGLQTWTRTKAYPFFRNPCDIMSAVINPVMWPNSTDPSVDLRLCGLPNSGYDSTSEDGNNGQPTSGTAVGPDGKWYRDPYGIEGYSNMQQETASIPSVGATGYSMEFLRNYEPYTGLGDSAATAIPRAPLTRTVMLSGIKFNKSWVKSFCADLLNTVPLIPRRELTTREGVLTFDYQTPSGIYKDQNLVPGGVTYDGTGKCGISVPSNRLMALQLGANEQVTVGIFDYMTSGNPYFTDNFIPFLGGWPFLWKGHSADGTTATSTYVSSPALANGGVTGFCTQGGLTLSGGAVGQPVTAIISPAHTRALFVFPIKSGVIITAQTPGIFYPALDCPYPGPMSVGYLDPGYTIDFDSINGWFQSKSRIRIPVAPDSATEDTCSFSQIYFGWGISFYSPPDRFLVNAAVTSWDGITSDGVNTGIVTYYTAYQNLLPGEYILDPGSISSPVGAGWIQFGTEAWVTGGANPGVGNGLAGPGAGGGPGTGGGTGSL